MAMRTHTRTNARTRVQLHRTARWHGHAEGLVDAGDWSEWELAVGGRWVPEACAAMPITCGMIEVRLGSAVKCPWCNIQVSRRE